MALIEEENRPGPRSHEVESQEDKKRIRVLEALLGVARAVIVSASIASFLPARREEIVVAIERLHKEHGLEYEEAARELGLCSRTLRRLRGEYRKGHALQPKSTAPKHPYGKLPEELAQAIRVYASLFRSLPLAELHRLFIRDQAELCRQHGHPDLSYGAFSRSSGRKTNATTEHVSSPNRGRDAPENIPYRALALMDTTDINCFGFDFKLIPFMEAHSRNIFAHQLCERERADEIKQVLEQGAATSGGVMALRVDRGKPYLAQLTVNTAEHQGMEMRVAQVHQATDKALIERFFRTAKNALAEVFDCIDLRKAADDWLNRKKLAHTIGSAVISLFLRYCYPYIPQPHVDGRTPEQRTHDAQPTSVDVIRAALDERVAHHEHAQTVARELQEHYGFRWSVTRWLDAARKFTAADLVEARRRFDRILLKECFTCDKRCNPLYLLAILRTVAEERRVKSISIEREKQRREEQEAQLKNIEQQEQRRRDFPEEAIAKAIDLAEVAFTNHGFGLSRAQTWLDQALATIAQRGLHAYQATADNFLRKAPPDPVRRWLAQRIELSRPLAHTLSADLGL
jgi:hypothetical protein